VAVIAGTMGLLTLVECPVPVGSHFSGCLFIAAVALSALTRWHLAGRWIDQFFVAKTNGGYLKMCYSSGGLFPLHPGIRGMRTACAWLDDQVTLGIQGQALDPTFWFALI
jgi:hypothetical protein